MSQRSPRAARQACAAVLSWLLLAGSAAGAEDPAGSPAPLPVPPTVAAPVIDGVLDEPLWAAALAIPLPYEVTPGENVPAPVETTVLVTYDERNLYVAFRCLDPEPEKIRARMRSRDRLWDDDFVGVVLDTFNSQRSAYELMVNPFGIQQDAINDEIGGRYDTNWDAIWTSQGRITDDGFTVEMAVPFHEISFQPSGEAQVWGFDAVRSFPRGVRHHIGTFPRVRGENSYLAQTRKIVGFADVDQGRNLEIVPTLTSGRAESRDPATGGSFSTSAEATDIGLTATWGVTPNWTLVGTLNPDFSQVEADNVRLTVNQTFAIFFPETRPFFLEGAESLATDINLVHTRTIADPSNAVKVVGKQGRHLLSALTARDEVTNVLIPGAESSSSDVFEMPSSAAAFRYRYDLSGSSTVGALLTERTASGYDNRVLSVDANLRLGSADRAEIQVASSSTRYNEAIRQAFGLEEGRKRGLGIEAGYDHSVRNWYTGLDYRDFDEDFRADLGFVSRVDRRRLELKGGRRWWGTPADFFDSIHLGGEVFREERQDGSLQNEGVSVFGQFNGPRQWNTNLNVTQRSQAYSGRLFGDMKSVGFRTSARPNASLQGGVNGNFGDWIDFANVRPADRFRLEPWVQLNLGRRTAVHFRHELSRLEVDGGRLFSTHVSELRSVYHLSRRAYIRAIVQYTEIDRSPALYADDVEARSEDLYSQLLFSYELNPQTAIFVGYSDTALAGDEVESLTSSERSVFLKLGYAWLQ